MDEAEKFWRAEQHSQTANNLAALLYLAIAAGTSGRDELGTLLAAECRDFAVKMSLLGVRPTDHLISTFYSLPLDEMKSLSFAAWGAYAWLTSVIPLLLIVKALTISGIVAFTTQMSLVYHPLSFQFLEIQIGRDITGLRPHGRLIRYLYTWERRFIHSASFGSLSKKSMLYTTRRRKIRRQGNGYPSHMLRASIKDCLTGQIPCSRI